MKWWVLEDHPWPDNYIAIIVSAQCGLLAKSAHVAAKAFESEEDALHYARAVKTFHKVEGIRLFYDGWSSRNVK